MDVDKRNEELDETIIQTCKWIQKKLQISDKSIRDAKSSGNDERPGGACGRQGRRNYYSSSPSLATRVLKNFANFFCCFGWIFILAENILLNSKFSKRFCILMLICI